MTPEHVTVRVLLLFGDQAEIVADIPAEDRAEPARAPIASAPMSSTQAKLLRLSRRPSSRWGR